MYAVPLFTYIETESETISKGVRGKLDACEVSWMRRMKRETFERINWSLQLMYVDERILKIRMR